jgi:hypothetical protein
VTEGIVGGQAVPLLALDHAIAQVRLPGGVHVHRVRRLGVEHVAIAGLAAELVGVAAGVEEDDPVSLCDLRDGKARCRADLTDDRGDLVALDQSLRLGRRRLRIHAVLGDQLDLAPHDAAAGIDFLDGERDAHHCILAERAKEASARCKVAEANRVGLTADNCGKAERGERCRSSGTLQNLTTTTTDRRAFHDSSLGWRLVTFAWDMPG